jgi:beta-galactosidase
MWAGIEYWGEPKGWPVVTSEWGVMDMARFPKDQYYYCLQEWTDEPMVYIFPHWTWPGKKGKLIDVWCYSNCDEAELFLNGCSLGKKPCKALTHIEWKVPYEPGTLTAKGIKNNTVVAEYKHQTAGPPQVIKLDADRTRITADNQDVSFVKVRILDSEGTVVPDASNKVAINVQGNGRLLGLCSGDPASHENPKAETMKAFNGLLLAIIQSTDITGQITVTATSDRLKSDTLVILTE